jgi:hypothetical protein
MAGQAQAMSGKFLESVRPRAATRNPFQRVRPPHLYDEFQSLLENNEPEEEIPSVKIGSSFDEARE